MRILRNYILREIAAPFILSLSALLFIMLVANLIHQADKIIAPGVSLIDILKLFISWIPYLLRYALPISLLMSILLSFGRISSDNEIAAMTASGFNLYRIIYPVIVVGLIFSLFSVILNDRIATLKIAPNILLEKKEVRTFFIEININKVAIKGHAIGLRVLSIDADTNAVTIKGLPKVAYIEGITEMITIDGAFEDWKNLKKSG